jgi:hypothetical protein
MGFAGTEGESERKRREAPPVAKNPEKKAIVFMATVSVTL